MLLNRSGNLLTRFPVLKTGAAKQNRQYHPLNKVIRLTLPQYLLALNSARALG
ncbi:hypothetical protein AAFN90_02655 [Erwiniaceae bacterium CAU 1747]